MVAKLILFLVWVAALAYAHHAMFYEKGNRFVVMVKRWPPGQWFHAFWGLVKVIVIAAFALWLRNDLDRPELWALLLWPVSDLWFRHWLNRFNGTAWYYMGTTHADGRAWFDLMVDSIFDNSRTAATVIMSLEATMAGVAIFFLVR